MDLDPSMQHIFKGASSQHSQDRHGQRFNLHTGNNLPTRGFTPSESQQQSAGDNYFTRDTHPNDLSFAAGPRQLREDPLLPGGIVGRDSYTHEPYNKQLPASSMGPTRLSLPPRRSYNQESQEPRAMSNASHNFQLSQNLCQGVPIYQTQQRVADEKPFQSPISQLATNMVFQKVMPHNTSMPQTSKERSATEPPTFFQGMNPDRLTQLQPAKQQVTPPFNLSGFQYSPGTQHSPSASSPFVQNSSPTTRASLRRTANRAAPRTQYVHDEDAFGVERAAPVTPPRQSQAQTSTQPSNGFSRMTHTLSLKHAPPMAHGIQLVSPHELPDRFRQVFPYELFNAAQSKCFEPIYKNNDNIVVSAPTGCGKTALLELAICKLVEGHKSGEFKIVYQAPTKSLCSERVRDWGKRFSHLNLACAELTGDTTQQEMTKVRDASIIITTPEKWDSITRKWKDHQKLLLMVKLFLIDEVHILKDARGATLEAVVSRMKSTSANVRFVALSATVPNSEDIAVWLGKNSTQKQTPAHRETFGEDFRPVKLQKHVHGFEGQGNDYVFEKMLDGKLPGLIKKYTQKKPIMVFCLTRKSCESTAAILAEWWTRQRVVDRAWAAPTQRTRVEKKELQDVVSCGVSFHHAGLDQQDRHSVESAYLKGDISVICCTSTLAMGVNLPCHLVVLKGTVGYQGAGTGSLSELSDLEVMQMLGRAGRPQFDDSAVAIIMTRKDKVGRYEKMISGQDILESTLHLNLIEHLNSEVGLGTIRTLHEAQVWLNSTFLSVRMRRNPDYYKLEGIAPDRDTDYQLQLVCERDLKLLQDHQLVTQNDSFVCTEYGNAMSRYMVSFDTMKLLLSLSEHAKTEEILQILCQASEFQDLRLKANEKAHLREINKSPFIKYPIKETITTTAHKISLVIQAQLGGVDFPNSGKDAPHKQSQYQGPRVIEKNIIFERVHRLVRCIIDCKSYDCDAIATRHALNLARSLAAEYWENSNLQLRQVFQIGPSTNRKLAAGNVGSIEKLVSMDTASIERIMGRNPPYGRKLLDTLVGFPLLTLVAEVQGNHYAKPGENPKVKIRACLGFRNSKIPVWCKKRPSLTFMAESSDGTLVYFWRANISKLDNGMDVKFTAELCGPGDEITCYISCDEIVGTLQSFKVTPEIPDSAFPPPKQAKEKPLGAGNNYKEEDEFGGDDFDDDDMVAAVKDADAVVDYYENFTGGYDSDEFVDIDDIDLGSRTAGSKNLEVEEALEPVQMENGRWTCNHSCRAGKLLKNGHPCKHKCCTEGLEKPRKLKNKSSFGTNEMPSSLHQSKAKKTRSNSNKSQTAKRKLSQSKLKNPKHENSEEVEIIDLADGPSPVPYSKLGPREYRKLHQLHTNVQEDRNMRIQKQKPHYSYTSENKPDFPFLKNTKPENDSNFSVNDDPFFSSDDDDDLPSPSALLAMRQIARGSRDVSSGIHLDDNHISSLADDSLESLEAAMMDIPNSTVAKNSPTPRVDTSFENRVFDFEAFDEGSQKNEAKEDLYSSPLVRETRAESQSPRQTSRRNQPVSPSSQYLKRLHSSSPERRDIKHRKLTKEERSSKEEPVDEEPVTDGLVRQESAERPSVPAWVDDMDPDIIKSLMGIVDFIE